MNIENPREFIGANNPPDPIDEATAPFGDVIAEAANWLDGAKVETEAQMKAVDELIKGMKAARKAIDEARDAVTRPLNEAWKAEIARWKPTQDDLDLQVKGLVALVDGFKRQLAAEKAEADRIAQAAAREASQRAHEAARRADATNIEATRAAAVALAEAEAAQAKARAARDDTVGGLKTYHMHEILDHRGVLHWIAKNDRDAVTAFITSYVAKNAKAFPPDLVRNYTEKRAF